MTASPMIVVQCWDDGVASDARLTDLLRRYAAKATFNLNAGMHKQQRKLGWHYRETEVWRLGWRDMREVYAGFTIANHTMTHPHLEQIAPKVAQREIVEGRERLQEFFGQDVIGFAYPFGTYNAEVMELVREAGHSYARTTGNAENPAQPADPMVAHPSCHFLDPTFEQRYEQARENGVFYFWGHSYELITETMWQEFEQVIARISSDPAARWADVYELFG